MDIYFFAWHRKIKIPFHCLSNRSITECVLKDGIGKKSDNLLQFYMVLEDKRFIIVAEHAYFSIDKADCYATTKQDFVNRLKGNVSNQTVKNIKKSGC